MQVVARSTIDRTQLGIAAVAEIIQQSLPIDLINA
jgi:hypothetical protein